VQKPVLEPRADQPGVRAPAREEAQREEADGGEQTDDEAREDALTSKKAPPMQNLDDLDLAALFALAESTAKERNDGHLTIMRFTTHWKAMFGTPNLDIGGREQVRELHGASTLRDALVALLRQHQAR